MHPAIIIGTVCLLWTWLWGTYHIPQNVFLVYFCYQFVAREIRHRLRFNFKSTGMPLVSFEDRMNFNLRSLF